MKALRSVGAARVEVGGEIVGSIDRGLLVLVGVEPEGRALRGEDAAQAAQLQGVRRRRGQDEPVLAGRRAACCWSRIHPGGEHPQRTASELLQRGAAARTVFEHLVKLAREAYPQVATGRFGADMQVHLVNDGPVTFLLES